MGEYNFQKKLSLSAGILFASSLIIGPFGFVLGGAVVTGKYSRLGIKKNREDFYREKESIKQNKKKYLENMVALTKKDSSFANYSPTNSLDKFVYNYFNSRMEQAQSLGDLEKYLSSYVLGESGKRIDKIEINLKKKTFGNLFLDNFLYGYYKSKIEENNYWNKLEKSLSSFPEDIKSKIEKIKIDGKKKFLGFIPYSKRIVLSS